MQSLGITMGNCKHTCTVWVIFGLTLRNSHLQHSVAFFIKLACCKYFLFIFFYFHNQPCEQNTWRTAWERIIRINWYQAYSFGAWCRWPGVRFTKVFRTELGHKYILVECSVIALCLPVVSKLSRYNSYAITRTMIGMSIKRISVLNLYHVLKPFVKSTPD